MIEISDIKACIQSKTLIQDEFFKDAEFQKDSRDRLIFYSGGYTAVFPCIVNNEKWAFRCWHTTIADAKDRYYLISDTIHKSNLPFFCSFAYIEKGLLVNGNSYPITKMKWVEGLNLKKYICLHCQNSNKIKQLAQNFFDMIIGLHSHQIAHGDLQHGNIVVSDAGKLFLVDYDSMYVPSMGDKCLDIISGLTDYQHPSRKKNKYSSEKLDYFSEVIIYASLLAIAENPELVKKYNVEDSEALLFAAKDFDSFTTSQIYADLKTLSNTSIDKCLTILEEYLSVDDVNQLLPIESYLMSINIDYPPIVPIGEKFTIKWTSEGVKRINVTNIGEVDLSGQFETSLTKSGNIIFTVISETGYQTEKIINIETRNRAIINHFNADKEVTIDGVPIKLSWDCSNADEVEIIGIGKQRNVGSIVLYPKKETTYILSVKDVFGKQKQSVCIRMLPIPQIKSLLIPTPNITNNLSVHISQPRYNVSVKMPIIDIETVKMEIPKVPSLTELSIDVKLSLPKGLHGFQFLNRLKTLGSASFKKAYKFINDKIKTNKI